MLLKPIFALLIHSLNHLQLFLHLLKPSSSTYSLQIYCVGLVGFEFTHLLGIVFKPHLYTRHHGPQNYKFPHAKTLVKNGKMRLFWWGLRVFSSNPPKHYLPNQKQSWREKGNKYFGQKCLHNNFYFVVFFFLLFFCYFSFVVVFFFFPHLNWVFMFIFISHLFLFNEVPVYTQIFNKNIMCYFFLI